MDEFLETGNVTTTHSAMDRLTGSDTATGRHFDISQDTCGQQQLPIFFAKSWALVRGLTASSSPNGSLPWSSCQWRLMVPPNRYLSAVLRLEKDFCADLTVTDTSAKVNTTPQDGCHLSCSYRTVLLSANNQFSFTIQSYSASVQLQILLLATKQDLKKSLRVVLTSPFSGGLSTPGYGLAPMPAFLRVTHAITPPPHLSVFLTFPWVSMMKGGVCALFAWNPNGPMKQLWPRWGKQRTRFGLYNVSLFLVIVTKVGLCPGFSYSSKDFILQTSPRYCEGVNIKFSFHASDQTPQILKSKLFNCSAASYWSFKHHLDCNLEQECEGGEDEGGHCAFSNEACQGDVAVGQRKCYRLHLSPTSVTHSGSLDPCQVEGGSLAVIITKQEISAFLSIFQLVTVPQPSYIGLLLFNSQVPDIYGKMWTWIDNSAHYSTSSISSPSCFVKPVAPKENSNTFKVAAYYDLAYRFNDALSPHAVPDSSLLTSFVCEYKLMGVDRTNQSSSNIFYAKNKMITGNLTFSLQEINESVQLTVCPRGQLMHYWLGCDWQAACHVTNFALKCPLFLRETNVSSLVYSWYGKPVGEVDMFVCDNKIQTLPYTLVCNFFADCWDGSDEEFCQHSQTNCEQGFRCASGQCIHVKLQTEGILCDGMSYCYDGSDEEKDCRRESALMYWSLPLKDLPARLDFGYSSTIQLTPVESLEQCPETHFSCSELALCLPVYVRCNRVYDCPHREDEMHCNSYSCPAFYQCRGSSVCLHPSDLCDGVAHCPLDDDEMLCDSSCPQQCHCQGLAFVCHLAFPADRFPHLRYLDGSYSQMTCAHLAHNPYLIFLRLASCNITSISQCLFPNLQILDLSDNIMKLMRIDLISKMPNLKTIHLSGNPLTDITAPQTLLPKSRLVQVDFSNCLLDKFDCRIFTHFSSVSKVNLSHNSKMRITDQGFSCFPFLKELDVRGTKVKTILFPEYDSLGRIERIFSDNYRHCCKGNLPEVPQKIFCFAPALGFSSCSDLLHMDFHKVCLWLMLFCSFLGNIGFRVEKLHCKNDRANQPVETFMGNLHTASCFMSIYLCLLAIAHYRYQGDFVFHEKGWVSSLTCKVAGFVAFVSCEASCLIVCLLAMDRVLALYLPAVQFSTTSVWVTCLLSWGLAVSLAAVPWLPGVSAWNVQDITTICLPLPVLSASQLQTYSFSVLVVFNTSLASMAALCQVMVYLQVFSYDFLTTTGQSSQGMAVTRRVMTVILTDVTCWLLGGILSLMHGGDVAAVNDSVMMSVLILILPLNSACSPLLFTVSSVVDRRQMQEEAQLVLALAARHRSRLPKTSALKGAHAGCAKVPQTFRNSDHVLFYIGQCLQSTQLNVQDVHRLLREAETTAPEIST